ncbi:XAC2610-related protein [Corticibacter populi]|nr:hypothetical protein [Corticibacter populi]RZS31962.1 hypothetical protein EV687_2644 [Corticibacter populi]
MLRWRLLLGPLAACGLWLHASADDLQEPGPTLLEPGLYRIEPQGHLQPDASLPLPRGENEIWAEEFAHAVPAQAQVRYAIVSRSTDDPLGPGFGPLNKLLFLTDEAYRYDVNSANRLCPAYAFPGWNYHSSAQPFCRTGIGSDEAILAWQAAAFSLSWAPQKEQTEVRLRPATVPPEQAATAACRRDWQCRRAAEPQVEVHYRITHRTDHFQLERARPYRDVLYVDSATPLHARPRPDAAQTGMPGPAFYAVLARDDQWYEVDAWRPDGSHGHGWLNRDVLEGNAWVPQQAQTGRFRFRAGFPPAATEGDDAPYDEGVALWAIEVIDRPSGRRHQVLRDFGSDRGYGTDPQSQAHAVQLVDANFDGQPDLIVNGYSGGAGPNSTDNVFLYVPEQGRFVWDERLSGMTQLEIDPATQTISTHARGGCCSHASETYRYIDGQLTLVRSWDESLVGDEVVTTTGEFVNGVFEVREVREAAPEPVPEPAPEPKPKPKPAPGP